VRQLYYTNYRSGNSGLSNAIMSIETGVVLAFLTNRLLTLEGNNPPPANLVDYGGRVDNRNPSRVTDLIELPVPWIEPDNPQGEISSGRELTDQNLMDAVFYVPGTVDIESADAASFARGRKTWLCEGEDLARLPVLRVSEQPVVPEQNINRHNLSFYSYFFYFDDETRRAAYQVLQRMQPKPPYAELARRVARDLGSFNAVHMRRGDFKLTYGVTVLDRQPWEAIESLEKHFSPGERLLICTDERADPFFREIEATWPDHVFIDHHILDNYGAEFAALPRHDCIALAYLSQLVAAESKDFVGTMTSTFTSLIQRYRGNRGKPEPFKFLWNELPDPGERLERGRHPFSECIPMDNGIMVEQFDGPYSWNRCSQLLNPAWMREWPESFLTQAVLESGRLADHAACANIGTTGQASLTETQLVFEGLTIRIRSSVPGLAFRLSDTIYSGKQGIPGNVFAAVEVTGKEGRFHIYVDGRHCGEVGSLREIPAAVAGQLVPLLTHTRRLHSWLKGMVFRRAGRNVILTGDTAMEGDSIADELCSSGWEFLADVAIPIKTRTCEVVPYARCSWPKGSAVRFEQTPAAVSAIVHARHHLHGKDLVTRLPPSLAVAELLRESIDFLHDRERAVKRLCEVVEKVPVFQLSFSRAGNVPRALEFLAELELPVSPRPAIAGKSL